MFGPRIEKDTTNALLPGRSASCLKPLSSASPSHRRTLHPRPVPAAVRHHQPVAQRQRLTGLERVDLIEHEGKTGVRIRCLADEPPVGITQIGRVIEKGER